MDSNHKKQHYIPRFLLRRFSVRGAGKYVYAYKRNGCSWTSAIQLSIEDAGEQNYFYNIDLGKLRTTLSPENWFAIRGVLSHLFPGEIFDDDTKVQLIETRVLQKHEDTLERLVSIIEQRSEVFLAGKGNECLPCVTAEEKKTLARCLAIESMRKLKFRSSLIKFQKDQFAVEEEFSHFYPVKPKLLKEEVEAMAILDQLLMLAGCVPLGALEEALLGYTPQLIVNTTSIPFCCADSGFSIFHPNPLPPIFGKGLGRIGNKLLFPIGSNLMVMLTNHDTPEDSILPSFIHLENREDNCKALLELNRLIAADAHRFCFCARKGLDYQLMHSGQ